MKYLYYSFPLLFVGFSFASCSNGDSDIEAPNNPTGQSQKYTMTIEASKVGDALSTRALNLDGKTLNATWATTENIYVIKNKSTIGTLKPQSNSITATLKGDLTGTIEINDKMDLIFPNSMIDYREQDGNLATIATDYDYIVGHAKVTEINGNDIKAEDNSTEGGSVKFTNMQSIVKFILVDQDNNPINATQLTIDARSDYLNSNFVQTLNINNLTSSWGPISINRISPTDNEIYAALRIDNSVEKSYIITATDGTNNYAYAKSGGKFKLGEYYIIKIKMIKSKCINDGDVTVPAGEHWFITGTGEATSNRIVIENGATATLCDVNINGSGTFDNSGNSAGITCEGNATIIKAAGTYNRIRGLNSIYPGILAGPIGSTLTIKGEGTLIVSCNGNGAGIGGGYGIDCGNIVIDGDVNTSGYNGGAGLGSGENSVCGHITINSDIVATGGYNAAGIGSGKANGSVSSCGNITINNALVRATGGAEAAGIGSGLGGSTGGITFGDKSNISAIAGTDAPTAIGIGVNGYCNSVTCNNNSTITMMNDAEDGKVTDFVNASAITIAEINVKEAVIDNPDIGDDVQKVRYSSVMPRIKVFSYSHSEKSWTISILY